MTAPTGTIRSPVCISRYLARASPMKALQLTTDFFSVFYNNFFTLKPPEAYSEHRQCFDLTIGKDALLAPSYLMQTNCVFPPAHNMHPVFIANSILHLQDIFSQMNEEYEAFLEDYLSKRRNTYVLVLVEEVFRNSWNKLSDSFQRKRKEFETKYSTPEVILNNQALLSSIKEIIPLFDEKTSVDAMSNMMSDKLYLHMDTTDTNRIASVGDFLTKLSGILQKHSRIINNKSIMFDNGKFSKKHLLSKLISIDILPRDLTECHEYIGSWVNHLTMQKQVFDSQEEAVLDPERDSFGVKYNMSPFTYISSFFGKETLDFLSRDYDTVTNFPSALRDKIYNLNKELKELELSELMLKHSLLLRAFTSLILAAQNRQKYFSFYKRACVFGIEFRKIYIRMLSKKLSFFSEKAGLIISTFEQLGIDTSDLRTVGSDTTLDYNERISYAESGVKIFETILKDLEVEEKENKEGIEELDYARCQLDFTHTRVTNSMEKLKRQLASELTQIGKDLCSWLRQMNVKVRSFSVRSVNTYDSFASFARTVVPQLELYIAKIPAKLPESLDPSNHEILEDKIIDDVSASVGNAETIVAEESRFRIGNYLNEPRICLLSAANVIPDRRPIDRRNVVKLASFNAEWLFPFPDEKGEYIWGDRKAAREHLRDVVKVMSLLDADIILLQEVQDCRALKAVIELMQRNGINGYEAFLVENRDVSFGQHVGIITRISPTNIEYINVRSDVSVAKNIFGRFTVVNEAGNETKLALIGLHLISGDLVGKRNQQANLIAQFVKDNIAVDEKLVILGDMNDYDGRLERISHAPYSDALQKLSASKGTMKNVLAGMPAHSRTQNNRGIVDHILVDQKLGYQRPMIRDDLVWNDNGIVSDHAPVTVEIKI